MAKKYVFKVILKDVSKPPVWRKIEVPANMTFDKFGYSILVAMGWGGGHLWQFSKETYTSSIVAIPNEDDLEKPVDARKKKISSVFKNVGDKFTFTYDFGDDWIHSIVLDEIKDTKDSSSIVIDAKGKCPPEDIGGPMGYKNFLNQVNDPNSLEYKSIRTWLGYLGDEPWDVKKADVKPGEKIEIDNMMDLFDLDL